MKIKYLTYFLCISIYLLSCTNIDYEDTSTIDKSNENNITLHKVGDFIINDPEITIDRVRDVVVLNNEESLIGWINEDKNEIFITNLQGELVSRFGKVGSGPEEFGRVSAFGFDGNDNLIVYDSRQDFFKIFTLEGELIDIYNGLLNDDMWIRAQKIFTTDKYFYLGIQESGKSSPNTFWKSNIIAQYTFDGKPTNIFGQYDPSLTGTDNFYKDANILLDENLIYTTHRTSPFIQVFDIENRSLIDRFGIQSDHFLISDEEIKISDPRPVRNQKNLSRSFVGESFTTGKYFYFYFFNFTQEYWDLRDPNSMEHYLKIYEKNHPMIYLGEIKLPHTPIVVTTKNQLFLLENDDPDNFTVGVYEILIH